MTKPDSRSRGVIGVARVTAAVVVVASGVALGVSASAGPAHPTEAMASAHLTAQQVGQMAAAALARSGAKLSAFKAKAPTYLPEKHQWRVFYGQTGPLKVIDGEKLVVIDDATGKSCVQQAMAVGPCT